MSESVTRTGGCVDIIFQSNFWKGREMVPTVCCVIRETEESEKMIGEIVCRRQEDLRPSLVGKAG